MPRNEAGDFEWIEPEAGSYAEQFGYRFRAALEERGLTQHAASRILKRPQGRISEYANGKRVPPIETLLDMITILDLDPRILFSELAIKIRRLDALGRHRPAERSEAVRERLEIKPIHLTREGMERDEAMRHGIESGRLIPRGQLTEVSHETKAKEGAGV